MRFVVLSSLVVFGLVVAQPEVASLLDPATHAADDGRNVVQRSSPPASDTTSRAPARTANIGWNEIAIGKDPSGHFIVDASVNGTPVTFLVDSGASDVVLSAEDARRAGIGGYLRYEKRYQTANGVVRAAPVKLREIRIGQLAVRSVNAAVNEADMGISLLGMAFLNRLRGWEADGRQLVLRF